MLNIPAQSGINIIQQTQMVEHLNVHLQAAIIDAQAVWDTNTTLRTIGTPAEGVLYYLGENRTTAGVQWLLQPGGSIDLTNNIAGAIYDATNLTFTLPAGKYKCDFGVNFIRYSVTTGDRHFHWFIDYGITEQVASFVEVTGNDAATCYGSTVFSLAGPTPVDFALMMYHPAGANLPEIDVGNLQITFLKLD